MMQYQRLVGMEMVQRQFDTIPKEAEEQLGVELAIIGREFRQQQQAAAPEDTGALRAGLSIFYMLEQLRVRVGLIGVRNRRSGKRRYGDLFYGRFVEFGRKAQTVIVQRRRRVRASIGDGEQKMILRTSRRRKVVADIVSTYSMKVKAQAPRPFIFVPNAQDIADRRLAVFWDNVLSGSGA